MRFLNHIAKQPSEKLLSKRATQALIMIVLAFCGVLFVLIGSVAENKVGEASHVELRTRNVSRANPTNAPDTMDNHSLNSSQNLIQETAAPQHPRANPTNASDAVENHALNSSKNLAQETEASQQQPKQPGLPNQTSDEVCSNSCKERAAARQGKFNGNLMDRQDLLSMAQAAKGRLVEKLKEDYGQYYESIFVGSDRSFVPISEGGESMKRLKRKLMIKVLSLQKAIREQDRGVTGCECSDGGGGIALQGDVAELTDNETSTDSAYVRYVWATGGHSASAGHGNLFNESYTAYMGSDARMVFEAIGIAFEERNYAMGGTASAAEISMCWQQIFGQDVDFFSWDYGMTDGRYPRRLLHFGYRGGISAGRPAFLGMRLGGRSSKQRRDALLALETLGMAVFQGTDESFALRNDAVPDSAGISEDEIRALPEYVRNLKCGEQIENGDPYCSTEKYTKHTCSPRAKQAGWHPGYKAHALDGHALGIFIVDSLIEALSDLAGHENTDSESLLLELQQEEDEAFRDMLDHELPDLALGFYKPGDQGPREESFDPTSVWKGSSICRTGRLPSQARFLGHTTNTDKVGNIAVLGQEEYEVGIQFGKAMKEASNGTMPLVYHPGGKERQRCQVLLKPDYKDFFLAHSSSGVNTLTIPNEKEREAYGYDPSNFKGILIIVLAGCDWGKCSELELRESSYTEGAFEITVNGERAASLVPFGWDAWIINGKNGTEWEPNADGIYEIGFEVKKELSHIKISSLILY